MPPATTTVVIPTYNRKTILRKTIEGYLRQTIREEILEILVVDDGSTDGTTEVVADLAQTSPIPIRYLRQEKKGQAGGRNYGIREARGEIILFGDDDVIPAPNMVEVHLARHKAHPEPSFAVMGHVPWAPEVHPTPLMRWSIFKGPQLGYGHLTSGKKVGFTSCLFGNASLKLSFLKENGVFDESFHGWGCEDWELGYRLIQKGMVMIYDADAVGYHYKRLTFAEMCQFPAKAAPSRRIFAATEAGKVYFEGEKGARNSRRHRLQRLFVRIAVPFLLPLKPLLDSQIPLPWAVYRAFYHYYAYVVAKPDETWKATASARKVGERI